MYEYPHYGYRFNRKGGGPGSASAIDLQFCTVAGGFILFVALCIVFSAHAEAVENKAEFWTNFSTVKPLFAVAVADILFFLALWTTVWPRVGCWAVITTSLSAWLYVLSILFSQDVGTTPRAFVLIQALYGFYFIATIYFARKHIKLVNAAERRE